MANVDQGKRIHVWNSTSVKTKMSLGCSSSNYHRTKTTKKTCQSRGR